MVETNRPISEADFSGLEQLVYDSRALMPISSSLQMSDILAEARPANAANGITGVLTAADGRFVQVIEGRGDALDDLLVRLMRDRRHTDLVVRERRSIVVRSFGDWDMVSPRLVHREIASLSKLLRDPRKGLDAFIPLLARAVAQQEAGLEGRAADALVSRSRVDRYRPRQSANDAEG